MARRLLTSFVLTLLLIGLLPMEAIAALGASESDIRLQVGLKPIPVTLLMLEGRTLVPLRAVGEALGATIEWQSESNTAVLTLGSRTVRLQTGATVASVEVKGQKQSVTLAVPALVWEGRMYVPVRFVAEGLGYEVSFDEVNKVVLIATAPGAGTPVVVGPPPGNGTPPAPGGAQPPAGPEASDWRRFDLNRDARFDKADFAAILPAGMGLPTMDVNGDGQKDSQDAWALILLLSRLDRNGDGVVDARDSAAPGQLALPIPDGNASAAIAAKVLKEVEGRIPKGTEAKLLQEWQAGGSTDPKALASLYEQAGIAATANGNLDLARWAYAKSAFLAPDRAASLSNLGFILSETERYEEALVLLAQARKLDPKACATSNNIGAVLSRNGQTRQAQDFYQEAANHCPRLAQYQLNLGVAKLRLGDEAGAQAAFTRAADLNPGDKEALLMKVASKPAKPGDLAQYAKAYADYVEEQIPDPEDRAYVPTWADMDVPARIEFILGNVYHEHSKRLEKELEAIKVGAEQQMEAFATPFLPTGTCQDISNFANSLGVVESLAQMAGAAKAEGLQLSVATYRKVGADQLSLDRLILELALTHAQAEMVDALRTGSTDAEARRLFEEEINSYYEKNMQAAWNRVRNPIPMGGLRFDSSQSWAERLFLGNLFSAMLQENCGEAPEPKTPTFKVTADTDDAALGLSLGLVGVECKLVREECKLQVGQGIIVAGTYSPQNGFGFQFGVGFDITEGPLKVTAASYLKFGSDGSAAFETEVGAGFAGAVVGTITEQLGKGIGGGSASVTATTELWAASHEPIRFP